MDSYAKYEVGDDAALGNALNKTKSAIHKMIASGADTGVYQKMLTQSAELDVTSQINEIASIAGEGDSNVVQARVFLFDGSTELLNAVYNDSVRSFVKAYNEALLAI